jgi:hypothetical protein
LLVPARVGGRQWCAARWAVSMSSPKSASGSGPGPGRVSRAAVSGARPLHRRFRVRTPPGAGCSTGAAHDGGVAATRRWLW